ncbi:MAG: T9SS type A sorting domain-containing protein [Chlorobi bacterium]|nr:T9SS type A sorting domain-containing protein [Chlorobiota bacterium]
MNNKITPIIIAFLATVSISLNAQNRELVNDTLSMSPAYAMDVFYSMADGEVASVAREGWDIAFYTNAFSAGIIINEGNGTQLYSYPNSDTAGWATFDTVGMTSWKSLSNSNESWEDGAFNKNATGHPDYGWGIYNPVTHGLTGDSLYLINVPGVGFKKLWMVDKVSVDNIYHIRYADVDGSNEMNVELALKPYVSKNFAYYSLAKDELLDREPDTDWDILFTKYIDLTPDNEGNMVEYLVTGATGNINRYANKFYPVAADYNDWSAKPFDSLKNTIGYDWKSFDMSTFSWVVDDSTAFFVMNQAGDVYKLVFTYWEGSSSGVFALQKELVQASFINDNIADASILSIYPNPATDVLNIKAEKRLSGNLTISDISGRVVFNEYIVDADFITVNISNLTKGLYSISIDDSKSHNSGKFIVK